MSVVNVAGELASNMSRVPSPERDDRRGSSHTTANANDEWTGYQWNVPLDEVVDCDAAPKCCRDCYYRHKGMSKKIILVIVILFVAFVIISTALVIRFSLGDIDIVLGAGNQRPITNGEGNFSPLMCSEYLLTTTDMLSNPVRFASSELTGYNDPNSNTSSSSISSSSTPSGDHSVFTPTSSPMNHHHVPTSMASQMASKDHPVVSTVPSTSSSTTLEDRPLFDAYLLLDLPHRSYRTNTFAKEERLMFPHEDYFNYWAMYLDSGSSVTIYLTPPPDIGVQLWIAQGKGKLDDILTEHELQGNIYHTFTPESTSFNFPAYSSAEEYAFIFTIVRTGDAPAANISLPVQFTISLKELVFDEAAKHASCINATRCSLSVPIAAASVMITVNRTTLVWPVNIRTECVPDIEMYVALFLGVPIGIVAFFLSCAGVLYLCQRSVMRDVERADRARAERARLPSTSSSISLGFSRSRSSRRAFRNTTACTTSMSHRSCLVDHDFLDTPPRYDPPPAYQEIDHVSSPALDDLPVSDVTSSDHVGKCPPSYESINA